MKDMNVLDMNNVVEVATEATEEIVKSGLNIKKVVITTVAVTAVAGVAYVGKKLYDKKQAKKNESVKVEVENDIVDEKDIIEE